jgi:aminoglycoside/choline kinase family phosphotransferase
VVKIANNNVHEFLNAAGWDNAACEPIAGDASSRRYFRLRRDDLTAVLMDASQNLESVPPFVCINRHLQQLGFSAPTILARDEKKGFLLLEDFSDATFARLLDNGSDAEKLYTLATDVLVTLHQHPQAIHKGLRAYDPDTMLADIELFLDWCTPGISEAGKAEFQAVWREALPVAHQVPASLLLRDYHVANLMLLSDREGVRQAGLLDFQDAYQGPITYDLVSLLEDARRDVPASLREKMVARYLAGSPALDRKAFETSMAILAALRHTRVLAIFERLSRHEQKHDYKQLHSPRVERLLHRALAHPKLAGVKRWTERYADFKK